MSGAVVMADGLVVGVVRSTNLAADGQSLTVTPLTAIDDLPDPEQRQTFWAALSVPDPGILPLLPAEGQDQSPGHILDYQYDVLISYWPASIIHPWIHNRFMTPFRNFLYEELGRQPSIIVAKDVHVTEAITMSRVLLAILSKQYFLDTWCRAAFESMVKRQIDEGLGTADNPTRLVHAIVAHDSSEEFVPQEYRGQFDPIDFKDWAYDFEIQDWQIISPSMMRSEIWPTRSQRL